MLGNDRTEERELHRLEADIVQLGGGESGEVWVYVWIQERVGGVGVCLDTGECGSVGVCVDTGESGKCVCVCVDMGDSGGVCVCVDTGESGRCGCTYGSGRCRRVGVHMSGYRRELEIRTYVCMSVQTNKGVRK